MPSKTYCFFFTSSFPFSALRRRIVRSRDVIYDLTTATSMKTSLKNRLQILSLFFAIIPRGPVTQKKGIWVGAEEKGPRLSSNRDGRIYHLAVSVPK